MMKHLPSDKYNVAWFKLAECVARGEKEKALGVYRLLVHSLDEPAFIRQLEGDLLLAFKDYAAVDKYVAAAELYQKSKKISEAAAVYEHIVVLAPEPEYHVAKLIELYQALGLPQAQLHQRVVLALLGIKGIAATTISSHLEKAIDLLSDEHDTTTLQIFLAKVETLDTRYYERATTYLQAVRAEK
jgi:tetratricopeptide (TPR) repeat protein